MRYAAVIALPLGMLCITYSVSPLAALEHACVVGRFPNQPRAVHRKAAEDLSQNDVRNEPSTFVQRRSSLCVSMLNP